MAKNKQPRPVCIFCGSSEPMTREHIFHKAWKDKLGLITELEKYREFNRFDVDNAPVRSKNEDLFSVIVKRVCNRCNSTWMADLDTVVEPWVFDPADDDNRCAPAEFRRWAIKIALLRCYYETPRALEHGDTAKIYASEDILDWHIFIGRTAWPEHRHAYCGVGPTLSTGGKIYGNTQVLWTLGHSLVVAFRTHGSDELTKNCLRNFKAHNRRRGIQVMELLPTAKQMPTVRTLPEIPLLELERLAWLFTPNPISPFHAAVQAANDWLKTLPDYDPDLIL